ncbi:glycosyltransferase family 2 protein [Devosia geojensis]|uniref:glycosyltransferase family 2 protein n=1 Tax=Devosia geojensis TaxID=443610 RepID=UPI0006965D51|nr:glycosyltransferase [Devosia geojensis]
MSYAPATLSLPLVSVIIPAFNRAATIRAAIESVLRQTYANVEVIVVDDCSGDDTVGAVRALSDTRLRLISTPRNLGSSSARNQGVAVSRGRWIAFQDSDDEWLPTKLEKQMARLLAPGSSDIAGYCGLLTVSAIDCRPGERSSPHYTPGSSIVGVERGLGDALLERNFVSTQTLVVSREALDAVGGFDETLLAVEDWDLALRLARHGSFAFIDEPLVLQKFSANSLSRDNRKLLLAQQQVLAKHADLFARHPDVLARHYYLLAGGCRRLGDLPGARAYLGKALGLRPIDPRFLAMAGLVALRGFASSAVHPASRLGLFRRRRAISPRPGRSER